MIDLITIIEILCVIILIGLSAFFSSSETAFISVNRIKMLHLAEKGDINASIIHKELQHPEKFITTILVGNNIVNITASVLVTALTLNFFGNVGIAIATGVMTVVILVLGEIVPKTFATRHADAYSLKIAGLLEILTKVLYPIVFIFTYITNIVLRTFGIKEKIKNPFITEDQIKILLKIGVEEGVFERHEQDYIHKVFKFTDKKAKTAMTYKADMVTVENTTTLDIALKKSNESGHSRLPVWKNNFNNIIGMIYVKDLLKYREKDLEKMSAEEILRPILTVESDRKIASIFKELQFKKIQIAVVVDENQNVVGLLSIEDIVEEIVGDILDEYDIEEMGNGILPKQKYLFNWDNIPGNDNGRIIDSLKQNYGIHWVETARIEKIDGGKTIILSNDKHSLNLKLNDEKNNVSLKTGDNIIAEFTAKMENGKLNIYKPDTKRLIR